MAIKQIMCASDDVDTVQGVVEDFVAEVSHRATPPGMVPGTRKRRITRHWGCFKTVLGDLKALLLPPLSLRWTEGPIN